MKTDDIAQLWQLIRWGQHQTEKGLDVPRDEYVALAQLVQSRSLIEMENAQHYQRRKEFEGEGLWLGFAADGAALLP
jgi:hypothetical protein